MINRYCEVLGMEVPELGQVADHREANTYSLLIVALLERGDAMTLGEVADRFEAAGVAPTDLALRSLKRCKPARAPVYRDGDYYALDPHDHEVDLWLFRLGLRPPKVPALSVVRPESEPRREMTERLSVAELDEAWREASLHSWSAQRLVLAVLDAHGEPLAPDDAVAFVGARTRWHMLSPESAKFRRRGSLVQVRDDGRWEMGGDREGLLTVRKAVRERVQQARRTRSMMGDPAVMEANRRAYERRRAEHGAHLAALGRVIVQAFPPRAPQAVVLVDVGGRHIESFLADELGEARVRIVSYDIVAALNVRSVLRSLEIDSGQGRLAELGPPQKSKRLNRRGRTLKITADMLIRGSCGVSKPFGQEEKMLAYLRDGRTAPFRRRLEADARSLFALYEYGRLHGAVRLRWGFLDEMIPAPWVHRDEPGLYALMRQAQEQVQALEVVAGNAPGWIEPWARAFRCHVVPDADGYGMSLIDEDGFVLDDRDIQLARLAETSS